MTSEFCLWKTFENVMYPEMCQYFKPVQFQCKKRYFTFF